MTDLHGDLRRIRYGMKFWKYFALKVDWRVSIFRIKRDAIHLEHDVWYAFFFATFVYLSHCFAD